MVVVALLLLAVSGWGNGLLAGPLILLLAAIAARAIAPAGDRSSVVAWLPLGFACLVLWMIAVAFLSGLMGWDFLGNPWGARLVLFAPGFLALILTPGRNQQAKWIGPDWPAAAFGLATGVLGLLIVLLHPIGAWSRITSFGTDFARHVWSVATMAERGGLVSGDWSYPRSIHVAVAVLVRAMGLEPSQTMELWAALSAVVWTGLVLLVIGCCVAARAVASLWRGGATATWSGLLAGAVIIQTTWFSVMLEFGAVMSIVAALALVVLLCALVVPDSPGSVPAVIAASAGIALIANAWQLVLPAACLGGFAVFVAWWRRGREPWHWVIWGAGAALSIPGILGLVGTGDSALIAIPTVSGLFAPDWWWWAGLCAAVVSGLALIHGGHRAAGGGIILMLFGAAATFGYLFWSSGTTWDLLRYYPVKALWTSIVLVAPLGSAAFACLGALAWHGIGSWAGGARRLAGRLTVLAVIFLLGAGFAGRTAAFPPHWYELARTPPQAVNWTLAVVSGLQELDIPAGSRDGAVVFGLIPDAEPGNVVPGGFGIADYIATEALAFAGFPGSHESAVKFDLYQRDLNQICAWLGDHPDAVRLTGPNPASGAEFLLDAGCSEDAVRPRQWLAIPLGSDWVRGTAFTGPDHTYPSWAEVNELLQGYPDLALSARPATGSSRGVWRNQA